MIADYYSEFRRSKNGLCGGDGAQSDLKSVGINVVRRESHRVRHGGDRMGMVAASGAGKNVSDGLEDANSPLL